MELFIAFADFSFIQSDVKDAPNLHRSDRKSLSLDMITSL